MTTVYLPLGRTLYLQGVSGVLGVDATLSSQVQLGAANLAQTVQGLASSAGNSSRIILDRTASQERGTEDKKGEKGRA